MPGPTLKVQKSRGGYGTPSGWYVFCTCCENESDVDTEGTRADAQWLADSGECHHCANDCESCAIRREYPDDFARAELMSR